ncbi:MAG: hemerythrin domain-containing protein [Deltaproteobacteria bacterium]|nr:hemerythrin domain-containing protein [Deltaproteobacteria bacterium]
MVASAVGRDLAVAPGYDEMARQHRAVRLEVVELRGMIDSCCATQRTDAYMSMLAVLVGRLRERLATHFELEQADHLERLARNRPELAADIERFQQEHAAFLTQASQLSELLRTAAAPPDTVARTMRWLDDLRRHESAEEQFVESLRA